MTLRELLRRIDRTTGKAVPTAAWLRSGISPVTAVQEINASGRLVVYQNGFTLYEVEGNSTVLRTDHCGGYCYYGRQSQDSISYEDFMEMDWWVRLLMEGEDRLIHNQNARVERNEYSLESWSEDYQGYSDDLQEQLEIQEVLTEALAMLTDRQREVVQYYYVEGLGEKEIARIYGISQQAVSLTLSDARKKLHKRKNALF